MAALDPRGAEQLLSAGWRQKFSILADRAEAGAECQAVALRHLATHDSLILDVLLPRPVKTVYLRQRN